MKNAIGLLALLSAVVAIAGCGEDVDSDDIATDAIYANIWVTAPGDGRSHVATTLRVGGSSSNTYLDLTQYDALIGFVNTTAQGLAKDESIFDTITYRTSFPYEALDTPYRIAFLRTPPPEGECAGNSAPDSIVTLPSPFSITSPLQDALMPRGSALSINWTNSGFTDAMSFAVDGGCIQYYSDSIDNDTGAFTIPANAILVVGTDLTVTCTATLSIYRSRDGNLDPNYGEGGTIDATQRRTLQFQTVQ